MKEKEYRRFVRKIALGLVELTDAQKLSKTLMVDANKERERIKQEVEKSK